MNNVADPKRDIYYAKYWWWGVVNEIILKNIDEGILNDKGREREKIMRNL